MGLFFVFIFVFGTQLTVNNCSILKFTNDWIRTADLWCRKRPHYQLYHHNHLVPQSQKFVTHFVFQAVARGVSC